MKEGWELKKLGEVCKFEGGSQPPKAQFSYQKKENYVRLIQIRDYKSDSHIVYIPKNKAKRFCNENDIMIGRYGPPVFQILKGLNGAYNVALMKAIPNEKVLLKAFVYLFLKYSKIQDYIIHLSQRAAGQTGVNKEAIEDYPILLPPLSEQKRIVAILDEVFAAIAKAKANVEKSLQNARELFENYLHNVFANKVGNWEEKKLEDICTLINGRAYKQEELLSKGKYRVLRVGNFFTNKDWYYSDLELPEDKYCDKGDLLYAWSASIGPRIWNEEKVIYHYHIWKVLPKDKHVTKEFLYILLDWDKEKIKRDQGTGTTMMHVGKGSMDKRILPIPTLKEQIAIVDKVNRLFAETQNLETIYQQKVNELEELKKSFLQKAFTGELTASVSQKIVSSTSAKVITLSTTDMQAGIITLALHKHNEAATAHTFGHVKSEKIVNTVQYMLELELDRNPQKDAAGPNDFKQLIKVESRAGKAGFFYVNKRKDRYDYTIGSKADSLLDKIKTALGPKWNSLSAIVDLFVPMKTQQAEIVATVFAAWNNLLIDGKSASDEEIVYEAREAWHQDKLNIPRDSFFKAISWMKEKDLVPKGTGKKVIPKPIS